MTDAAITTPVLPCIRCGYDLTGTPLDGQCGECGMSAQVSREMQEIMSIRRRRAMARGAMMMGLSLVPQIPVAAWISWQIMTMPWWSKETIGSISAMSALMMFAACLADLIALPGSLIFASKERKPIPGSSIGRRWRLGVRWIALAQVFCFGLIIVSSVLSGPIGPVESKWMVVMQTAFIAYVVLYALRAIAVAMLSAAAAEAFSDPETAKFARRLRWQIPLLYVVGAWFPPATVAVVVFQMQVLYRIQKLALAPMKKS